jgi:hypothetical protein
MLAEPPTITRISQQVLPTAVTPTLQSILKAWRTVVICTERGTDTECYCVCCEGLAEGYIETLWRVAVNCGPENAVTEHANLHDIYKHITLNYSFSPVLIINSQRFWFDG